MQFVVPQFIEIEDKIIGPLTMKQFMMLLGVGVLLLFLWYFFALWFVLLLGGPLVLFIMAVIFIKINGRPFWNYFTSFVKYISQPKIYIWKSKK